MSKYKKIVTKILIIILGLVLVITGSGVIFSSIPITSTIVNLAKDNHIVYAFLWLILLLFVWAIGVFIFIMGILVHRINDDDDKIYNDDEMIE